MIASEQLLLGALLDSCERDKAIVIHLLRVVPKGALEVRATPDRLRVSLRTE